MKSSKNVKIQTFVPVKDMDKVRLAIGNAGGGIMGNYTHCTFVSCGKGYFLPMNGSNPTIGQKGRVEKVEELKIEFHCNKDKVKEVVRVIKEAHPYEEVPIDIIELYELGD